MPDSGLQVAVAQPGPIPLAVDLTCAPGELLALVGPSGCGKTTLLRTIAGLYQPLAGRIACDDAVWWDTAAGIHLPPHRRPVGLVFQNYALFPHMTVIDNVLAALGQRPREARAARARALLERVHLGGLEQRRPAELSGGQQQRVAVARALARDPRVLLLDEPFSAVDKLTRQALYRELAELRRDLQLPIILVTHDFDEAARLADRMCLLYQGRLLQTGTPREVLAHPVSALAARLVDLRNRFSGTVLAQCPQQQLTRIRWDDTVLDVAYRPEFVAGSRVLWAVPSTQVILQREDAPAPMPLNRLEGVVGEIAHLSESTTVAVHIGGRVERALALTVPEHYARRTGLQCGSAVTVALLPEGIHLMPDDDTDKEEPL